MIGGICTKFTHRYPNMRFQNPLPTLLVLSILVVAGCGKKKDEPVTPAPGEPQPPAFSFTLNGPQGVQMTLDGAVVKFVQGEGLFPYHGTAATQNPPPTPSYNTYSATMHNAPADLDVFAIHMGTLSYTQIVEQDAFEQFFAPGVRPFGFVQTANVQRVQLDYRDAEGVLWATHYGSGAQEGSTFTITDSQIGFDDNVLWAKVLGSFNCTLYNSAGIARTVTDGTLMFEFQQLY
jgi:hypothetical protein